MLLDPFVPLESHVVEAMLTMADLKAGEKHVDLGSGDGRVVVSALKRGAQSYGVEIDRELAVKSAAFHGIKILVQDVFETDVSEADLVTFWFIADGVEQLVCRLKDHMKAGSRIAYAELIGDRWLPAMLRIET